VPAHGSENDDPGSRTASPLATPSCVDRTCSTPRAGMVFSMKQMQSDMPFGYHLMLNHYNSSYSAAAIMKEPAPFPSFSPTGTPT
jgi:hypothetical protein